MSLNPHDRRRLDAIEQRLGGGRRPARNTGGRGRYLVASSVVLAFLVAPLTVLGASSDSEPSATASGTSRGEPVQIQIRNRSRGETGLVTVSNGYSMRLSNKQQNDGGGAIYGCRSGTGKESCVAGDNLNVGQAFFFRSRKGSTGGRIEVNGPNAKPFTTNATGVATGLNADQLDGLEGSQLTDQCPGGTVRYGGACIEAAARAAEPFASASLICGNIGRRLALPSELEGFRQQPGITLAGGGELTNVVYTDGAATEVQLIGPGGATPDSPVGAPQPYRCVAPLTNA